MKPIKNLVLFFTLIITSYGMAQDESCDDFTDLTNWPATTYTGDEIIEGDTIGYTQGGTQTVTFGPEIEPYNYCQINGFEGGGIFTAGVSINFAFDGSYQQARFRIYGFYFGPSTQSFSVNGSPYILLTESFPMIIDDVLVDLDTTLGVGETGHSEAYLTFTGALSEVSKWSPESDESGILELCIPEEISHCNDFTDLDDYPATIFWPEDIVDGEVFGTTQDGLFDITFVGPVEAGSHAYFNAFDTLKGIFGWQIGLDFEFSGIDQLARYELYYYPGAESYTYFSVNGSIDYNLESAFPLTIGSVIVDFEISPDVVYDDWTKAYLTFDGPLNNVVYNLVESGIHELCINPLPEPPGCDDLTRSPWPLNETFEAGEVIGFTQDGAFPVTVGDAGTVLVNSDDTYFPGLFTNNAPVIFDFDGTDQHVRIEIYEWFGAGHEGFALNGEESISFDDAFPMTVDGVEVNLELSGMFIGTAEVAYLTFDGPINEIVLLGGEIGITQVCYTTDEIGTFVLGVESNDIQSILMYPNPASGFVTIQSTTTLQNIRIYTVSGALVFEQGNINNSNLTLSTEDLEKGLYLVEMYLFDGTKQIEKLIIE